MGVSANSFLSHNIRIFRGGGDPRIQFFTVGVVRVLAPGESASTEWENSPCALLLNGPYYLKHLHNAHSCYIIWIVTSAECWTGVWRRECDEAEISEEKRLFIE